MRDDDLYLKHILEAIERILQYTSAGREAFEADLKTQDAVIRNLQVIGEAAKRVSEETRAREPAVPWRNMTGLRDQGLSADLELAGAFRQPRRSRGGRGSWQHGRSGRKVIFGSVCA